MKAENNLRYNEDITNYRAYNRSSQLEEKLKKEIKDTNLNEFVNDNIETIKGDSINDNYGGTTSK